MAFIDKVESGRGIPERMKLKSDLAALHEKCAAEIGSREAAELIKKAANPKEAFEALSALKAKVVLIDVF